MDLARFSAGVATEKDEAALLTLINLVQPHVPWSREQLSWQFFEGPAGPAKLYVIRDGAAIISLYAAVPQWLSVDGRVVEARMVQDVMTHPDFRGRGFLHQLGASCALDLERAHAVGYTFPNNLSEKSFRRGAWSELTTVPARTKALLDTPRGDDDLPVAEVESFAGGWAGEVWSASEIPLGIRRDDDYLNWRYRKPNNRYFKFKVGANRGLLVFKIYEDGARRILHLLELVLRANSRALLPDLLRFCERFGRTHAAESLTAWLPDGHPYASGFDEAGLTIDSSRVRFVFVRPAPGVAADRLTNAAAWHLTQGDSDVY